MRRARVAMAAVCLMLTGCRHKSPPPPVIPPPAPVAIAGEANPKTPPLLPTETPPAAPMATVPVVPAAPEKKVKKTKLASPPAEVVAAAPPPAAPPMAIGSLSAAGESTAESRKAVSDLIAANERRLGGLSAEVKDRQKDQIVRVKNFQVDARKALAGGDAEGAMTLATKAKVLLDEMSK